MEKIKKILPFVLLLLVIFIILCLSRYLLSPLPVIKQLDCLLQTSNLATECDNVVLNIALAILKTTGLVLQAIGIGVAILAALGIKEILNLRRISKAAEDKLAMLEKDYDKYRKSSIDFERKITKKISLDYNLIQAKIFHSEGFSEDAWAILSKMPDNVSYEICLYKGMVLTERKDYSDAITYFEAALKFSDADKARVYFNLGSCWYENNEYAKAIEEFDKAINIKSNYWSAYNNKALALKRLGKIDEAIKILKRIVSIDSKYDTAYYNLACYHALLNHPEDALKNLSKSIQLNPKKRIVARKDKDFANISDLPEFKELIKDDETA